MGRLIISNAVSVNGAFEAPVPEPDGWLVLDSDSQAASLEMWQAADAMVIGRRTYEGLAAVWPELAKVAGYEAFAARMNGMSKYVASRTLSGPLEWNATLLEGDLADAITAIKQRHSGDLIVTGCGELAHELIALNLVDELRFWVNPALWATGPRILNDVGPVRLQLTSSTTFSSGVVRLCYQLGATETPTTT